MIKLRPFFILIFCFFYSCSGSRKIKEDSKYFVPIHLVDFSSAQQPLFDVVIEGRQLLLGLDLGFRGDIAVQKNILESIHLKDFIGERVTYGIKGNQYVNKSYRIPKAKIGSVDFSPPVVQEENEDFQKDSIIATTIENHGSCLKEVGRVGWKLFQNILLLIDIPNSRIVFCDSFSTLTEQSNKNEFDANAPLYLDRGLVEFDAETENGPLRCVLDTGATISVLNSNQGEKTPLDQLIWNVDNVTNCPSLKIDGEEFGPITFCCLPILTPIRIEAILGIDFFRHHKVLLDFKEKRVYFSKIVDSAPLPEED